MHRQKDYILSLFKTSIKYTYIMYILYSYVYKFIHIMLFDAKPIRRRFF